MTTTTLRQPCTECWVELAITREGVTALHEEGARRTGPVWIDREMICWDCPDCFAAFCVPVTELTN